jgi:hypothetical protein
MNQQEIIKTVRNLPLESQRQILDVLQRDVEKQTRPTISEDEVERILFERGIIGNLTNADAYTDEDDDFEPVKIKGKPLSETVIEDRE